MLWKILALSVVAGTVLPSAAAAQDPLPIYPENYKLLLENDRVRVLDFQLRKGAKEDAHSHPAHVAYILAPMKIRFTLPNGETRIREAKPGDVLYSDPVTHASENIGDTDAHGILVEMKAPDAGATAALQTSNRLSPIPPDENLLTAVTFIRGLPGKEAELQRELLALEAPTRAETGNFQYDLYRSPAKPNEFMRLEVWRDEAALEAHKATPHLKASFEKRRQQGWTTEITLWRPVAR